MNQLAIGLINLEPRVFPNPGNIGIYTNRIHFLRINLVDVLPRLTFCANFMNPMDPQKEPNYYTIVTKPMDVKTIRKRLANFYYKCSKDLLMDVVQIIANCKMYYKRDDPEYIDARQLQVFVFDVIKRLPRGQEVPHKMDRNMLDRKTLIHYYYKYQIVQNFVYRFNNSFLRSYFDVRAKDLKSKLHGKVHGQLHGNQKLSVKEVNIELKNLMNDVVRSSQLTKYD